MNDQDLRDAYAQSLADRASAAVGRPACPPAEHLERLATGTESEAIRLRTLDHVMQCPACRHEFELLRSAHEAAKPRRRFPVPATLAAALAVAAVGGVLWIVPIGDGPDVFRGADAASGLVLPVGTLDGRPDQLVWRPVADAIRYEAEIMDASGAPLFAGATADTVLPVPSDLNLIPGTTLRWRLRAILPGGTTRLVGTESFRMR